MYQNLSQVVKKRYSWTLRDAVYSLRVSSVHWTICTT